MSPLFRTGALVVGTSFLTLSKTAVEEHRHATHQSIDFNNPNVERGFRTAGAHLADTKAWASVHRVHHRTADANLVPFVEVADYLRWHDEQTVLREGQVEIPDVLHGLDPALPLIDIEMVQEIGEEARELVEGKYQPRTDYTAEDAQRIMFGTEPRYFYEDKHKMKRDRINPVKHDPSTPATLEQIRFLLRDPHSPALHRQGIPGVLLQNVPLYGYAEQNFQDPFYREADLQPDELDEQLREHRGHLRLAYVGAMMLAGVAVNKNESVASVARNGVLGAAASGAVVLALIQGGNITNGWGHAGDTKKLTVSEFMKGVVHPKPDGTYTNNSKKLGPATLDEVGGQETHHEDPSLIAYTREQGVKRGILAPFGRTLEAFVNKGIVFKVGDNFSDLEHRPDMPSSAVVRIQDERARYLAQQEEFAKAA